MHWGKQIILGAVLGGSFLAGTIVEDFSTHRLLDKAFNVVEQYENLDDVTQMLYEDAYEYFQQENHVQASDNLYQIVSVSFILDRPVPRKVHDLQILTYHMGYEVSLNDAKLFLDQGNLTNAVDHLFMAERYDLRLGVKRSDEIVDLWQKVYDTALHAAIYCYKQDELRYADDLAHDAKFNQSGLKNEGKRFRWNNPEELYINFLTIENMEGEMIAGIYTKSNHWHFKDLKNPPYYIHNPKNNLKEGENYRAVLYSVDKNNWVTHIHRLDFQA
jgi:hypothetical protein